MVERLVIGAGPTDRDGGVDLFLEVAGRLAADPSVGFVWLGNRGRSVARRLDEEVRILELQDRFTWPGTGGAAALAEVPKVLVVTARTAAAARRALDELSVPAPVVAFAMVVDEQADPARRIRTVPYPDTAALADGAIAALGAPQ